MESIPSAVKSQYRFDNSWVQARERLASIEVGNDPGTIRHLEALGVGEGWRCLEVGGGGGSITEWLCRRVGSSGHVVATDVKPAISGSTRFSESRSASPQHCCR